MADGKEHNSKRAPWMLMAAAVIILVYSCVFPFRVLIGEWYSARAERAHQTISTQSPSDPRASATECEGYREMLSLFERALKADPGQSRYASAIADIYRKIGTCSRVYNIMDGKFALTAALEREAMNAALAYLEKARKDEPLNAYNHLLLGAIHLERREKEGADRHFKRAMSIWPHNAGLRYAISREYLLAMDFTRAFEESRAAAAVDDSYYLPRRMGTELTRMPMSDERRMHMQKSYLFSLLEIAWRASGRDRSAVESILPQNEEAREVGRIFFEAKGME